MSAPRRSLYSQPPQHVPPQTTRVEIIEPVQGLNTSVPATLLKAGETPFSQNMVISDRYLTPRSGMSYWCASGITGTPLGYFQATIRPVSGTIDGALLLSSTSVMLHLDNDASAFRGGGNGMNNTLFGSSATNAYFSATPLSIATTATPAFAFCNTDQPPGTAFVNYSGITRLTEFYSIDSYARYVASFDERLVFFNSAQSYGSAAVQHPVRASWTARGNFSDFTNGGFEDLIDMRGFGTGLVAEVDRLVLFNEHEVWAGRPRRDAYAFDFFALDKGKGMPTAYARTVQNTDAGTIWLGEGFQFFRLVGNEVRPLGDKVRGLLRKNMREWSHCWSFWNDKDRTYGFMYSDTTGSYPNKALFLRVDTVGPAATNAFGVATTNRDDGAWFQQDFGAYQFTAGGIFAGEPVFISSAVSPYRLKSTVTSDAGTAIDVRWRSHVLQGDHDTYPMEMLQELWIESDYDSATTSTLSVWGSADNAASFVALGSASIVSGLQEQQVAVSAAATRNTIFELRLNDGTLPRIARMQARLRSYTGRYTP